MPIDSMHRLAPVAAKREAAAAFAKYGKDYEIKEVGNQSKVNPRKLIESWSPRFSDGVGSGPASGSVFIRIIAGSAIPQGKGLISSLLDAALGRENDTVFSCDFPIPPRPYAPR